MMLLALIAQAAQPHCLAAGAGGVTLTGTIRVRTDPGDPPHGRQGYRYASLMLDAPICVRTADGAVTATRAVELIEHAPNLTLPFRFKGDRVSVTSRRITVQATPNAPLPIALEDPSIVPAQD